MDFPKPARVVVHRNDRPFPIDKLKEICQEGCPCKRVTYGIYVDRDFAENNDIRDISQAMAEPSTKVAQFLMNLPHDEKDIDPHPEIIDLSEQQSAMVRKSRYSTVPTMYWNCPHCGRVHVASELLRLDNDNLRCVSCGKSFPSVPDKK